MQFKLLTMIKSVAVMFFKLLGGTTVVDNTLEFKWGYIALQFGLELKLNRGGYFTQYYSLDFCFIYGKLYLRLPFKTKDPESCEFPSYGFSVFEDSITFRWGDAFTYLHLPLIHWRWVSKQQLGIAPTVMEFKYRLDSGEVQERTITCTKYKFTWARLWLPFIRKVKYILDVSFNEETGNGCGSWKGGVYAMTYNMNTDEDIASCVRRLENDRNI